MHSARFIEQEMVDAEGDTAKHLVEISGTDFVQMGLELPSYLLSDNRTF